MSESKMLFVRGNKWKLKVCTEYRFSYLASEVNTEMPSEEFGKTFSISTF